MIHLCTTGTHRWLLSDNWPKPQKDRFLHLAVVACGHADSFAFVFWSRSITMEVNGCVIWETQMSCLLWVIYRSHCERFSKNGPEMLLFIQWWSFTFPTHQMWMFIGLSVSGEYICWLSKTNKFNTTLLGSEEHFISVRPKLYSIHSHCIVWCEFQGRISENLHT